MKITAEVDTRSTLLLSHKQKRFCYGTRVRQNAAVSAILVNCSLSQKKIVTKLVMCLKIWEYQHMLKVLRSKHFAGNGQQLCARMV
jgi:hypothetical protein